MEAHKLFENLGEEVSRAAPDGWISATLQISFYENSIKIEQKYLLKNGKNFVSRPSPKVVFVLEKLRNTMENTSTKIWTSVLYELNGTGKFRFEIK